MPDLTVNYGWEIPKADGSDLNEPNRWRTPIIAIDAKVKQIDSQSSPVSQGYTVAWTSSGTAPTLGNATLAGRYTQIGKYVFFDIIFQPGSTTTFGSGGYFFSAPVPIQTGNAARVMGTVMAQNSGNYYMQGVLLRASGTTFQVVLPTGTTASTIAAAGATTPWTLKANDSYEMHGWYEAA